MPYFTQFFNELDNFKVSLSNAISFHDHFLILPCQNHMNMDGMLRLFFFWPVKNINVYLSVFTLPNLNVSANLNHTVPTVNRSEECLK